MKSIYLVYRKTIITRIDGQIEVPDSQTADLEPVHASTSTSECRLEMNAYFAKQRVNDPKMTCEFAEDALASTLSENYSMNPRYRKTNQFVMKEAPSVNEV